MKSESRSGRFAQFALFVLFYNFAVILWGAWVRVSLSGDGCGQHWPTCHGDLVPSVAAHTSTWVEFLHRASSGLCLVWAVLLVVFSRKLSPLIKKLSKWVLFLTITEALVGAALVIFGWVALDKSVLRAISTVLHLGNTFLLIGSIALTGWVSNRPLVDRLPKLSRSDFWVAGFFILTGMAGALTALGDTLFTSTSLIEGIKQDLSPYAHFLLKLRVLHPVFAITLAGVLLWQSKKIESKLLQGATWVAVLIGGFNLGLLAPAHLQLLHLFWTDVLWVIFIWGTFSKRALF